MFVCMSGRSISIQHDHLVDSQMPHLDKIGDHIFEERNVEQILRPEYLPAGDVPLRGWKQEKMRGMSCRQLARETQKTDMLTFHSYSFTFCSILHCTAMRTADGV
jgi:hypothetical protein